LRCVTCGKFTGKCPRDFLQGVKLQGYSLPHMQYISQGLSHLVSAAF
jgi:hypothetical protein